MQDVLRQWRSTMTKPSTLAAIVLATFLALISGPFGTLQAFSSAMRLVFWVLLISVGGAVAVFIRAGLRKIMPSTSAGMFEVATVIVFTVCFGGCLLYWSAVFERYAAVMESLPPARTQLFYLAAISGAYLWIHALFGQYGIAKGQTEPGSEETSPQHGDIQGATPRLMSRLQAEEIGKILYLAADGHFVEVHGTKGQARLRMRFGDALREMDAVKGYRIHRSYWVSADAIAQVLQDQDRWHLKTPNGNELPVSKAGQGALVAAGVITG